MLNKNLKLNKVSNVTAINCMVGSKDMHLIKGPKDIYLTLTLKDMHITHQEYLSKEFDETGRAQIDNTIIHVNSLDDLIIKQHEIREVNWIKIDVEGAELDVLKGAHNILSNNKRIKLLIEIHGVNKLYKPIVELLNSYNFKIIFEKDIPGYRSGDRIGVKNIIAEKNTS
jgi:FkbM family methyltransferase